MISCLGYAHIKPMRRYLCMAKPIMDYYDQTMAVTYV